ncbi:MAG: transposase [Candidatus Parcubacteria bacterium]|nr:transposase [Candidatus Parcubacteria bacterium]
MRKEKFITGEYYHIYNRGVDRRDIFLDEGDYGRFLKSMLEFNSCKVDGGMYRKFLRERSGIALRGSTSNLEVEPLRHPLSSADKSLENSKVTPSDPLVAFIAYCLNPNHFHLVLRQEGDDGIVKFMQRLGTAYTMYFNKRNERSGALFQSRFKAVQIDSEEHLFWVSAYVNGNAQIHGVIPDAAEYKWCSYPEYLGLTNSVICNKKIIPSHYKDLEKFKKASEECFRQMKERKDLQKYILD